MSVSIEDARAADPAERLLEESWTDRERGIDRREAFVESLAGVAFLACAVPLAVTSLAAHHIDVPLALALVLLYAIVSSLIKFPIGVGYVVPSYLVLVPMLLLLPPGTVPLLTAAGLVLGTSALALARRVPPARVAFAVPDAWHALGPALVLVAAGTDHDPAALAGVYLAAFAAGCMFDFASSALRERAIHGVASGVQLRVLLLVWSVDACLAPLGLLAAHAMRGHPAEVLLIVPLFAVMLMLSRERNSRIEQAQRRLQLVAHERARLQRAVRRLGDALAAKLDLDALTDIVLRGSIDALDAEGGRLTLSGPLADQVLELGTAPSASRALRAAAERARESGHACQLERHGAWALALPFGFTSHAGPARGAVAVARANRPFREDERIVMEGLVERAREAAADIVAHRLLREQALTDALTGLGNRRKLVADLDERLANLRPGHTLVLALCDLDGFKTYNDTFGHQAGDILLGRLGSRLAAVAADHDGGAYRLGGDEFCALLTVTPERVDHALASAAAALEEHGENFAVAASLGSVLMPAESHSLDYGLQLADERMYSQKRGRRRRAGEQAREVLIRIIHAKQPLLQEHCSDVARLCLRVGRRLGLETEELDELVRAAEVHDIGKVGIPDAILDKSGELTAAEWDYVKQHAVLGERILGAAPALRPIAHIVRHTHERWDGRGYPDGLAGELIPLAARIIAACDAYEAIAGGRSHRSRRGAAAAISELRHEAGAQFDATVVAALLGELEAQAARPVQHSALAPSV